MFNQRMSLAAAGSFCRRFGTGLHAGADLISLLNAEAKHGPARQREAIRGVAESAADGESLAAAMQKQKPFFPALLVAMTRVGEATGRLERTLLNLGEHYEQQLQLRRAFLTSLAWPGLQLFGGIVVISLLILLMGILRPPTGGEMTDILGFGLRGVSGVLTLWLYLALFFGLIGGCVWAYFRNIGGLQNIVPLLYMIPLIGPAIQTITLARFSWTLSLALDAGLDPIRSIALALESTDSDYYRRGAADAESAIRQGASLAGGLEATDVFPEDYLARVEMAELSGTDAESIGGLAREYDGRARIAMKTIAGLASGGIWAAVVLVLVFLIARMLMSILGAYSSALEGI